ncbi:MAG: HAD-IIIA family hydrolase [Deltaproteobacteria bacterium]|nr:HAD-IIIA family hydrolase [Deltaproteobacteria bacterium]
MFAAYRHFAWVLALSLVSCGALPEQLQPSSDRLSLTNTRGKGEFPELTVELPCLAGTQQSGDKKLTLRLTADTAFSATLSQPSSAAAKQAYARLYLVADDEQTRTPSAKAPELVYEARDDALAEYGITVENRSSSRKLCSQLTLRALDPYRAPTQRQTFADRLPLPSYVDKVVVAFFDADATLRIAPSGSVTPKTADDVMLLPGVISRVRKAQAAGHLIAIVSNQGGVHWGSTLFSVAEGALATTARLLAEHGATVHWFDFAEAYDDNRKPQTGMGKRLEQALRSEHNVQLDWKKSYMIGDAGYKKGEDTDVDGQPGIDFSNSDRGFAENLKIDFVHARDAFGWLKAGSKRLDSVQAVEDFLSAHPHFAD